jgi:HK97 family phage portal protein
MKKILLNDGKGLPGKIAVKNFTKASAAYLDDFSVGETLYPALIRLTDKDCWQLYKGNDWITATVNRIVTDCVKVQPKVLPKDDGSKISGRLQKRILEVQNFLDAPNPNKEAFFEIREKTIRDLLIIGRGCIEKVLSPARKVKEIYSTSPEYIKIQADQHGTLPDKKTYILRHWRKDSVPTYFDIDQLIYMTHMPISKSAYGIRILDAIANTVAADILRATYNANFFLNGAEAAGIIGLEGMNNKELKKFQNYWRENFRGAKNAHKTAAVNVPVKYVRMAITNRDLEFNEYGKELRMRIFAAYGMLPFVLGLIDENTGKLNSDQQMQIYKDGALKPILMKESYYYTNEIVRMGFGYDDIQICFPSIDLLDFQNQSNVDRQDAASGITTINEIRTQRGKGHVPWGDTPISVMPGGGQVDPRTGKLIPPSQNQNGKGKNTATAKKPAAKKPTAKEVLNLLYKITKIKVNAIVKNYGDFNIPIEGNVSIWDETPFGKMLSNSFENPVDAGNSEVLVKYAEFIVLTKHIVYENISKGTVANIKPQIDQLIQVELEKVGQ